MKGLSLQHTIDRLVADGVAPEGAFRQSRYRSTEQIAMVELGRTERDKPVRFLVSIESRVSGEVEAVYLTPVKGTSWASSTQTRNSVFKARDGVVNFKGILKAVERRRKEAERMLAEEAEVEAEMRRESESRRAKQEESERLAQERHDRTLAITDALGGKTELARQGISIGGLVRADGSIGFDVRVELPLADEAKTIELVREICDLVASQKETL